MNKIDLLHFVTNKAKKYNKEGTESVKRNSHMNELSKTEVIEQKVVDAVVVDFINFIGMEMGIDFALYTKDLQKPINNG